MLNGMADYVLIKSDVSNHDIMLKPFSFSVANSLYEKKLVFSRSSNEYTFHLFFFLCDNLSERCECLLYVFVY